MTCNDPIWTEQPDILYRGRRLTLFIPKANHTLAERFNALTRFFLVLGLLLVIYRKSFLIFIPCCILPIVLLVFISEYLTEGKQVEEPPMTVEVQQQSISAEPRPLDFARHMMTPINV